MDVSEKIFVKKDSLGKILTKLRGLKVMAKDKEMQLTIDQILELLDDELKVKDISVEEMIRDKMDETKISNPEKHLKLYMLYRKLVENKITEEEALNIYELNHYY